MTYVVPKAIMVHHRRVKSALSFSFLHPVINNHGTAHMRWMVELITTKTPSLKIILTKDCDCRELHLYLQIAFDLSRPVHTRFQNGGISKGS